MAWAIGYPAFVGAHVYFALRCDRVAMFFRRALQAGCGAAVLWHYGAHVWTPAMRDEPPTLPGAWCWAAYAAVHAAIVRMSAPPEGAREASVAAAGARAVLDSASAGAGFAAACMPGSLKGARSVAVDIRDAAREESRKVEKGDHQA